MRCQSLENAKPKYKKGLWSPEEDNKLRNYILKHGHGCWSSVPIKAGLQRNGKSCRLRWINYLRPGLKRGVFSKHEEDTIMTLQHMLGNKWSQMAQHLPGRTDNEIKNYWHSYLKKKLVQTTEQIQHASSSSDTMDNSLSPEKPYASQDPCYGLLQNMHKFDHYSFSQNYNFSKDTCQGTFPKLLFAEWFSMDHVSGSGSGSSVKSDDSLVFGNELDQNSIFQEAMLNMSEGPFGEEYHNSLTQGSVTEVYNSKTNSLNQMDGNDFVHCLPGADLCSNFSLTNDAMYV